jgi:hypothetical protein
MPHQAMNDLPAPDSESRPPVAEFVTTHWSVVLAAGRDDSRQVRAALEKLCQTPQRMECRLASKRFHHRRTAVKVEKTENKFLSGQVRSGQYQ